MTRGVATTAIWQSEPKTYECLKSVTVGLN